MSNYLRDKLLIPNKIPFVLFNISFSKNEKGETVKKISKMPKGWMKWNYEECIEYNKKNYSNKLNCMNINLTNSNYMIIDIDAWNTETNKPDKELVDKYLNEYGDYYQTTSTRKKLPHLWRKKNTSDKNTTKTSFKNGLDLVYTNIFEYIDSEIQFTEEDIPVFEDYPKEEIKEKKEKKIRKRTDSGFDSECENKSLIEILNLIPNTEEGIIDYNTWFKIICSLRNDNINNYNIAFEWSKKSPRHTDEHFDYVWSICKTKNSIGTLYFYAKSFNPEEYNKIFSKINLSSDDDNLSKTFIKLEGYNIVYSNNKIYIYNNDYWIEDDNKNLLLKKKIRTTLKKYATQLNIDINTMIQEDTENEANEEKKKKVDKIYNKSTKKRDIDNICSFVIQDLAELNKSVIFDIGEEQKYNLHFKNGVYEISNKKFRKRTRKDYITKTLQWSYNEDISDKIYNEVKTFYSKLQIDKKQMKFSLQWLAYCLTGSTAKQKFKMNIGYKAQNGKSTEFKIHHSVFDIYSFKLDNKTFNDGYEKRHKQIITLLENPIRFAYCEELHNKLLDVDFIKDFVDGSNINCEVMYGTAKSNSIQSKLSSCSNKDFNLETDKGILRRGLLQYYESTFIYDVVDNYETKTFLRIDDYEKKFLNEEYKNAYLKLLLEYYEDDFKAPKENEDAFKEIADEYDLYQQVIDSNFKLDNNSMIHKDNMLLIFKEKLDNKNLSWRELLTNLKSKGITYKKDKMCSGQKGFFIGISLIDEDEIIEEE